MSAEHEMYLALFREGLRRCMAEEDVNDLHNWLTETLLKMGGKSDGDGVLWWEDTFAFYDALLAKREADAAIPASERKALLWAWASWNRMIDPLPPGMLAVISAGDGMGKCLGKGTKVLMYDGTLRNVENVVVGDLLMGPDSTPRKVLALGRGREQMYRIRQNIGIEYRCNASHLLSLKVRDKNNNKTEQIIEARNVAEMPEWYIKRHLQGYKVPVEWPAQDVQLDPYFLGLWLGDGMKINGTVLASDNEVIDWLKMYAARLSCGITVKPDNERNSVMRVLISNGRGGLHVRRGDTPAWKLSEMGLIGNKHIPQQYITNSSNNRLELLAGLIDSDGYYDDSAKAFEITQKDEQLARQIKLVADTLGFSTTLRTKRATIKDRGVDTEVWRLTIRGDIERIPVRVPRKKAFARVINKDWRVTGFAIQADGEDEYYGFMLDGDRRFLLEDMTVTHNTTYAEMLAEEWALQRNKVVFVHYELAHAVMMDRRYARHTGMTARELKSGELTPVQRQLVKEAHDRLRIIRGGITYQHSAGWTMERTVARLRQLKADGLCDVVVIDYLEKNAASRRQLQMFGSSPYQREADNVEQIKNFAELTETPVVLLAQMSKAGKSADFSDIDRTSMRGAGEKSEKANVVVLLHRDKDDSSEGAYSNTVNVRVDKNTLGPTGKFVQWMRPETFSVYDVDTVRTELN